MRQKTLDAIMAHAAAEYPRECCGVVAQKSRVERYFPCRNLASEPTEQFHLSPEDYAAAEDWGTIFARPQTTPTGSLQNVAYSNMRNVIMAINCANYD